MGAHSLSPCHYAITKHKGKLYYKLAAIILRHTVFFSKHNYGGYLQ